MNSIFRLVEKIYAVTALFFMTGSLIAIMSPDELAVGVDGAGSPHYRMLGLAIGGVAFLLLAMRPKALLRYWIVFIPVLVAVASISWSVSPGVAFRRCGSLIITTVFAIWLGERFTTRTIMNLLLGAMALVCISSYVSIFAFPNFGIHNPTNTINPSHFGAWRGMLGHKNDFGRMLALASTIFLVAFLIRQKWRWVYLTGWLSAIALIGGSHSGQAVVLAILPAIGLIMLLWLRGMPLQFRSLVIIVTLPIGLFVSLISNVIVTEVLNILGKDPTLTGRSDIWSAALSSLGNNIFLGGGYGTGWEMIAAGVFMRMGGTMTHAHNGYLDLLLDVGVFGLSITLAFYAILVFKLRRILLSPKQTEAVALGLVVLIFIISGNWVASFLLQYNSIYWVLPVLLYVKLTQIETAASQQVLPVQINIPLGSGKYGPMTS
ncbi:hypothetical protein AA309_08710 [Microvirga vignae]|uniref:O-antigen ligase-related domain-containing protein n=1 Tax=Microvirga vignae TaxID=1225564 RepID=A0A0H1RLA2_9HYPH|nr:O-antigen ligase family protein [Microvirga vignae]KLK93402.1 hypothetical protein AA309_08710 [Microvirga vignae]